MQRKFLLIIMVVCCCNQLHAQEIVVVKDSIMQVYMQSGFASKKFIPEGKHDENDARKGQWKDYEVINDGSYFNIENSPLKIMGTYLWYGEGAFKAGKRDGKWNIYIIEDKSFKKILSKTCQYTNGIQDGSFEYFYPNGNKAQIGTYVNDSIEGNSTIFYLSGKVFGEQFFTRGKKNGLQKYYYESGSLSFTVNYENGYREGSYHGYYEDGKIKETFTDKADSITGIYQYYYPNGKLWTETIYNNGLLMNVTKLYDKDGNNLEKGSLKDGDGTVNFYTEDKKVYLIRTYLAGKVIKEEPKL